MALISGGFYYPAYYVQMEDSNENILSFFIANPDPAAIGNSSTDAELPFGNGGFGAAFSGSSDDTALLQAVKSFITTNGWAGLTGTPTVTVYKFTEQSTAVTLS